MKIISMILAKDLRRFYPLLLVWAALLLSSDLLPIFGGAAAIDDWTDILAAFRWLFFGLITIIFIQADGLTGDRDFWMSRPIPPLSLVGAKLLGLGLVVVLPSVALLVLMARALHADGHLIFAAWVYYGFGLTALTLVVAAFAAITKSAIQCVLTIAAVLLVTVLTVSSLEHFHRGLYRILIASFRPHNILTTWAATLFIAAAFALGIIFHQAITRRRQRSIFLLIIATLLLGKGSSLWPVADLHEGSGVGLIPADHLKLQAIAPAVAEILQNRISIYSDTESASPMLKVTQVETTLSAPGLPSDHFVATALTSSSFVADSDKRSWKAQGGGVSLVYTEITQEEDRMIRQTLGWGEATEPQLPDAILFNLSSPDYRSIGGQRGRLEAKFAVAEYRLIVSEVPLLTGAKIRADQMALTITRIRRQSLPGGTVGVLVNLTYGGLRPWREGHGPLRHPCAFLVNRSRREIIKSESSLGNLSGNVLFPYSMDGGNQVLPFNLERTEPSPGRPKVDENWLKDATLVVLAPEWIGTVSKDLVIDNFTMPLSPPTDN